MSESTERKKDEQDRSLAVGFGMTVYTGGVIMATAIFIYFILTAFPESAYFIRFLMVLAALCVGASALAFRYALENWTVSGWHRIAAIGFYYGEIGLVSLNTIVSFAALLYKFAGNNIPSWVSWYEPFTVATIGYVILAWGTLFVLDPRAQSKAKRLQVLLDFDNKVIDGMSEYLGSEDGLLAIQENANERIRQNFAVKTGAPAPWINRGQQTTPLTPGIPLAPSSPARPALQAPAPVALPSMGSRSASRRSYTLDGILNYWRMSRMDARDLLAKYRLFDAGSAFDALQASGYIPSDFGEDEAARYAFMLLFCELVEVTPTWNPVPTAFNPGIHPNSFYEIPPAPTATLQDRTSYHPKALYEAPPNERPVSMHYTNREDFDREAARQEAERQARKTGSNTSF